METLKHNKTRLGIGSYSYSYAVGVKDFMPKCPMSAEMLIDRAVDLRVKVVQIADNLPLHILSDGQIDRIGSYAEKNGISLEVGTRGIRLDLLRQYIRIAERLQSPLLRCVIDSPGHEPGLEEIHEIFLEVLPDLKEHHVVLGIENHDRFSAAQFEKIIADMEDAHFGIVLDTVNSFACEENTQTVLSHLGKYTVNFHAKDFKIGRVPNAMGLSVTGTPAGEGFLNVPAVLSVLQTEAQSDFSTILELWMSPEPTIEQTIEKEDQWVRKSVQYLRTLIRD
ncbi:MAG: sugar phosphate isomerase/epimerase [Ruminococcaceae bacterium]|nr:sugar phosphate isomerase/epimerase [Oscillospiraceae bacterium]